MKKLSNTEAELKKKVAYKKKRVYVKKVFGNLEKYLWHDLFWGESCWITYHNLLKVKSNKDALREIWQKCCL